MKLIPVWLLLIVIYTSNAGAGIGSIDEREYVDWSKYPYNQIVYFYTNTNGTCTAEYVASDLILTARHCITSQQTFDNYKEIGKQFYIKLHNGRKTQVTLEKYGHDYTTDDWAILRITDNQFYSNNYFSVSQSTQLRTIENAGFGYMRILSDAEIKKLKTIFKQTAKKHHLSQNNFVSLVTESFTEATNQGIPLLLDLTDEIMTQVNAGQIPDHEEYKLKAHRTCKFTKYNKKSNTFHNNCDAMQGNSGGPYFANNTIYGIVSRGSDSFNDKKSIAIAISPIAFIRTLQTITPTAATTTPTTDMTSIQQSTEQEIIQREKLLTQTASNLENMTDKDFFNFLSDVTEYKALKERYEAAKAREQSTANKLLGAAAIGATGIGGMMAFSGLAEQRADEAAERDMKAYLATFMCDYGQGRNIKGGTTGVQLPNAPQLLELTTEYKSVAAELKTMKAALNMQPGIESEVVLNSAETGLYNNASIGAQPGAFTSLSRALQDKDSADAAAWAEQKAGAKSKTTTGAAVAGTGAIGGAVGNLIINRNNDTKK